MERIDQKELHLRMRTQGVSSKEHIAFRCAACGTVQSMASLIKAGAQPETVERYIGFSCEGRFSGVGPWPSSKDKSKKAQARRQQRGCDWTLGGLFKIHRLEVVLEDGKVHPSFEIAEPHEARALEAQMRGEEVTA